MTLTVRNVLDLTLAWANANVDRISKMWPLAGGWEAWAQAEIAAYINAQHPGSYVVREANVYVDGSRCDLLVNDPAQSLANEVVVVEMKCESLRNWEAFVEGLRYDTWKLNGPMRMGLGASGKIALGFFFSPQSEEHLGQLTGFTVVDTGDGSIGVAAVSW